MIKYKFMLITLLMIFAISIYADKDTMVKQCHHAHVPTICMQCLESNHNTSLHADPIGIAVIIIHCLDSHLHILIKNITEVELYKKEEALSDCKNDMLEAIKKLPDVNKSVKRGDYDKAGQSLKLGLLSPKRCRDNLRRTKLKFYQIYSQINIYIQLSDAAMRIIDRF
ncbi:unnamed protein product [Cochlearia groenlandica]